MLCRRLTAENLRCVPPRSGRCTALCSLCFCFTRCKSAAGPGPFRFSTFPMRPGSILIFSPMGAQVRLIRVFPCFSSYVSAAAVIFIPCTLFPADIAVRSICSIRIGLVQVLTLTMKVMGLSDTVDRHSLISSWELVFQSRTE